MKKLLIVLPLVILVGCASSQPVVPVKVEIPTVPEFDIRMMTRSEVVSAVNECENNDMKPFVEYISQKTTYGRVMVPVNVHCNPLKK
jgi:hypothetical protein